MPFPTPTTRKPQHAELAKETSLCVGLDEIGRLHDQPESSELDSINASLRDALACEPRPGLEELHSLSQHSGTRFLELCEREHLRLPASAKAMLQFVGKCSRIPTKAEVLEREMRAMEELRSRVARYPLSRCVVLPHPHTHNPNPTTRGTPHPPLCHCTAHLCQHPPPHTTPCTAASILISTIPTTRRPPSSTRSWKRRCSDPLYASRL